jgi:hypothetical protein
MISWQLGLGIAGAVLLLLFIIVLSVMIGRKSASKQRQTALTYSNIPQAPTPAPTPAPTAVQRIAPLPVPRPAPAPVARPVPAPVPRPAPVPVARPKNQIFSQYVQLPSESESTVPRNNRNAASREDYQLLPKKQANRSTFAQVPDESKVAFTQGYGPIPSSQYVSIPMDPAKFT